MKLILSLMFLLLASKTVFSQKDSLSIDPKLKDKIIYYIVKDNVSAYNSRYVTTGNNQISTRSRRVSIDFRVGENGEVINIGRKGRDLKKAFNGDKEAIAELEKAYRIRNKMRLCNATELLCAGTFVVTGLAAWTRMDDEDEPFPVGLTVVSVTTLGGMYFFYYKTEQYLTKFGDTVLNSIEIYNKNLQEKTD